MSYRAEKLKNGVTFDFEVKFDLEGRGQSPPQTIGILTKVFYTYGPNLVILAWTGDELSRGQASDYRTHGGTDTQTDAGNDNTRRPQLASGKKLRKLHCGEVHTLLKKKHGWARAGLRGLICLCLLFLDMFLEHMMI